MNFVPGALSFVLSKHQAQGTRPLFMMRLKQRFLECFSQLGRRASWVETIDFSEELSIARNDETLRDGRLAVHQRQRHFARGPTDLVIDAVLRHEVAYFLT